MKKLIILWILNLSLFGSQVVELSGDKGYPPYSYSEDGKAKGVYVDVIKIAFGKMPKYDVKFNMIAWKRAIAMTKNGKTVGFFPPYYSDERTKWTKFSESILGESSAVFAQNKTLKNKIRFPEDFYGLTVCLNRGFTLMTGGTKFKEVVENKKIKLIEGNDNKACLSRVSRDIADFYINDQLIDISQFPQIKRGLKATENFGHIGFTLKTKNYPFMDDLQRKFNKVIKHMKKSGEIDNILKKYR